MADDRAMAVLQWLGRGDSGASSKVLALASVGITGAYRNCEPGDENDSRRCERLAYDCPFVVDALPGLIARNPGWKHWESRIREAAAKASKNSVESEVEFLSGIEGTSTGWKLEGFASAAAALWHIRKLASLRRPPGPASMTRVDPRCSEIPRWRPTRVHHLPPPGQTALVFGKPKPLTAAAIVERHLLSVLPPGVPPQFSVIKLAEFRGRGPKRTAVAWLTMVDGLSATIEVFGWGAGCSGHRWLEWDDPAIFWDGKDWQRDVELPQ